MPSLKNMPFQIAVAFDQLLNTLCGGWADETFSARCYRLQQKHNGWAYATIALDVLFFWQKDHCKTAFESELSRKHSPVSNVEKNIIL